MTSAERPDFPAGPTAHDPAVADQPLAPSMSDDPGSGSNAATRRGIIGAGIAVVAGAAGFTWYTAGGPKQAADTTTELAPVGGAPAPAASAGGTPTALSTVAAIPENGGVVLPEQQVVLTRETGDTVHCFTAVCTHAGCLVSQVTAGKISCPCHGSVYDAKTGAVVTGPAPAPLAAVPVSIVNGSVYSG